MTHLLAIARTFAIINFLFLPAIGGAVLIALLGGGTYWFAFWSVPAFLINGMVVFSRPVRTRVMARVASDGPLRKR